MVLGGGGRARPLPWDSGALKMLTIILMRSTPRKQAEKKDDRSTAADKRKNRINKNVWMFAVLTLGLRRLEDARHDLDAVNATEAASLGAPHAVERL
jgi:hypothetical protein